MTERLTTSKNRTLDLTIEDDGWVLIAERGVIAEPAYPGGRKKWVEQRVSLSPEEVRAIMGLIQPRDCPPSG